MRASNQFFVPHNVLEEAKFKSMTLSAQILYIHLCKLKNRLRRDKFYRDINTLCQDTGLHRNTIKKAKRELVKNLYIDIEKDWYKSTGYRSADRFHLNGYRGLK